jgi:hypothetical protein
MSATMQTQMVQDISDDDGMIDSEIHEELSVNINIRDDDIQMFEMADGSYILRTPDMDDNVFIQPVPGKNGFSPTVVVEPEIEGEVSPADPAEQPEVEDGTDVRIRMD